MVMRTKLTATVVFEVMTEDDEELDGVCAAVHQQFDTTLLENDWIGTVELSWKTISDSSPRATAPRALW